MEISEISERVKKLITSKLDIDIDSSSIEDDSMLVDYGLGVDSVTTLEFIVAIEDEFGINIDETEITPEILFNVKSISSYIHQQQ